MYLSNLCFLPLHGEMHLGQTKSITVPESKNVTHCSEEIYMNNTKIQNHSLQNILIKSIMDY